MRTAVNEFVIQFENTIEVTSLHFNLKTSPNIIVDQINRGSLLFDNHWIIAKYGINESNLDILIISSERKSIPIGQGVILTIPFQIINPIDMDYVRIENAIVTIQETENYGIDIKNLELNKFSTSDNHNKQKSFEFGQNYPNPFNSTTRIAYRLNKDTQVRLSVYDAAGREINRLIDQYQNAGDYNIGWNSNTNGNRELASGIYFIRLLAANESVTHKMVLSK